MRGSVTEGGLPGCARRLCSSPCKWACNWSRSASQNWHALQYTGRAMRCPGGRRGARGTNLSWG
eukprot:10006130-Lingulodinium_polyedra.AAC.1